MATNDEAVLEATIQAKGLNGPRLHPEDIDRVIVGTTYTMMPSLRTIMCELTLKNGFTVYGQGSCASVENFDEVIGRNAAYADARRQVWQFEAYLLKERLYQAEKDSHGIL